MIVRATSSELLTALLKSKKWNSYTKNQSDTLAAKHELATVSGFKEFYLDKGQVPAVGSKLVQSKLGETLDYLGRVGLDDFYVGDKNAW